MPATPTRSVQRGGLAASRQRKSSSLHPPTASTSALAATAGQPYPPAGARGGKGAHAADPPFTPFIHPALALANGVSSTAGGLSSSAAAALSSANTAHSRGRRPFNHRNLFAKDLRNLMYAYGDSPNPDPDSVTLMEEMTVDFITDLCCRARPSPYALGLGTSSISNSSSAFGATLEQFIASADPNAELSGLELVPQTLPPRAPHRLRVKLEDFRHALRKDVEAKKLGRMEQLLYADKVVTEARRVGGVEEAAERAGALQTDNLPPPSAPNGTADGSKQNALAAEDDDEDDDDFDSLDGRGGGKSSKSKRKGGGGGAKGGPKAKGGGGAGKGKTKPVAASKPGSARGSVQP